MRLLLTLRELNAILTESNPEVQKTLIFSKSREGTAEFSRATRFSNTYVSHSTAHKSRGIPVSDLKTLS